MKVRRRMTVAVVLGVVAACVMMAGPRARADVKLPRVIWDNMVLQREAPIKIWGWAEPGEKVTVTLGKGKEKTEADKDGNWMVKLPRMKAGGPYEMTVAGKNTITVKDILVGEVWVCSGQSNMQWGVNGAMDPEKEIPAANYPKLRLFLVPNVQSAEPAKDVNASWVACTPATVPGFSAVAYFFGREIQKELDVPVGMIAAAWGGSRIEPWTTAEGVKAVTELGDKGNKEKNGEMYNGMVAPLVPLAIRGALWYQGESNMDEGMLYCHRMHALIKGWRKAWGQGDFPFGFVQLAPHNYGGDGTRLAAIWEAQTEALKIQNTGMAVINDIGNVGDIHPKNKQEVGRRLALWAMAKVYEKKGVVYSGPLYRSMDVKKGTIRVRFNHWGGGLVSRDGKPLTWFTIAGEDKKFVPAKAEVEGKSIVVVSSDEVKEPVAVRFGWDQTAEPNLMNKEGLPASAFRTDKW